jgi:hypothetical protein
MIGAMSVEPAPLFHLLVWARGAVVAGFMHHPPPLKVGEQLTFDATSGAP